MNCPRCGRPLDPEQHGDLVCDGQVFCSDCHRYHRGLLEPLTFLDIADWTRRICEAFSHAPPRLLPGPEPLGSPFDFLREQTTLLAETYHDQKTIVIYPAGRRLATLCHELAHLMTGEDHTEAWARRFAELVAWVTACLPTDPYTLGFAVNLLAPRED